MMKKTSILGVLALPLLPLLLLFPEDYIHLRGSGQTDYRIGPIPIEEIRLDKPGGAFTTDLVAYWKLNELSGTRAKTVGSCVACDLTAVNDPTAMGGAGKYAMFTAGTTNYASVADNSSLSALSGCAAWVKPLTSNGYIFGSKSGSSTEREWQFTAGNIWGFQADATYAYAATTTVAANERALMFGWWDSSDHKVHTQKNLEVVQNSSGTITGIQDSGHAFEAGSKAGSSIPGNVIGPLMCWKGGFPDSNSRNILYNSGLGYSCANLPSVLRTNLVACWDLDEASGTRVASVSAGASCTTDCNLTAVNTPGRAAGLVQGTMGMSAYGVAASSQTLSVDDSADISTGNISFTAACWVNPATLANSIILDKTDEYRLGLSATSKFYAKTGSTDTATWATATTAGTWSLVAGGHNSDHTTWVGVNGAARVTTAETAAPADTGNALRIFSTSAGGSYFTGAVDACGFWKRNLDETQLTALYAAGAGVEYPWSSIASLFDISTPWASLPTEDKQRIIYAKYGVYIPSAMFPSHRVFVR
jgi:hypothetical protein